MSSSRTSVILNTVFDFIFLVIGFFFFIWIFPQPLSILFPILWFPFVIFSITWLFVSIISGKYLNNVEKNLFQWLSGIIVCGLVMFLLAGLLVLLFKNERSINLMFLTTAGITVTIESVWALINVSYNRNLRENGKKALFRPVNYPDIIDPNKEQPEQIKPGTEPFSESLDLPMEPFSSFLNTSESMIGILGERYLRKEQKLYAFLKEHIPLNTISPERSQVVNTRTLYNIQNYPQNTSQLFINLHRINDIRRINQFFIQVNDNLVPGGYFVGCALTKESRKELFLNKYPKPVNWFLYLSDFVFRRIVPKTPLLKELYFSITKGENRILSCTEILGRLFFCGFDKVITTQIDGYFYFVFRKVRRYREDTNPSYGLLIRMNRIGYQGRIIPIFKLRTMHPYSEYIQDYVFQQNALDETGKFKSDFRITTWGRIFRKLWIDELPQLVNLLRGQIKLVGVRALTRQYFSLYPPWLQELRIKTKPGLIPPYYVDNPRSFDEICASEKKYLERYLEKPWKTDWVYFWKALYNILFKRARSR